MRSWIHTFFLCAAALILSGCVAPPWQQRDAARSLTTSWEKVGFTDARQMEILKDFGCSDIKMNNPKTFRQLSVGENCVVLGEKIPSMWVSQFPPTVAFAEFCPPHGVPADPNRPDVGRQVQARLNARIKELSQQVFQGKAEGRLEGLVRCPDNHLDMFVLRPILN